jgi:tryptophan-rich sensory protein
LEAKKMKSKRLRDVFLFISSIAVCQLAGFIGSVFTAPNINTWYAGLRKPFFTPPDWVFAPVWTALYTMMGVSLFLIWRKGLRDNNIREAFIMFMVQLILNTGWSIVFFGTHSILGGFLVIAVMCMAILFTTVLFYAISPAASILLLPYLLWVSFASVLNLAFLLKN